MLQQLAHARAEARQSQVQLEEANARAAAASSGGPMARAKSAEQAAKHTIEAAVQVSGDSTCTDVILVLRVEMILRGMGRGCSVLKIYFKICERAVSSLLLNLLH